MCGLISLVNDNHMDNNLKEILMYEYFGLIVNSQPKNYISIALLRSWEKSYLMVTHFRLNKLPTKLYIGKVRFELYVRGSCKKFCHWVRITSVLRFIKHSFITNLQNIPPLLKHIFVTFLLSREKADKSPLLVSVWDTDK